MKTVEIIRPYERDGDFPIDVTTLFFSYEDALKYAQTDLSAYATQIIGVDDKTSKTTGLYKVDYDPNRQYRYTLKPINIGSSGTMFNFKGLVPSYDDLPTTNVAQGDLFLVTDINKMEIAYLDSAKNVSWKELSLDIQYATKTTDGILTSKIYSTLFNENKEDSLYFSKAENNGNPENNTWITVTHTVNEATSSYSIPSLGKVKELISSVADNNSEVIIRADSPVDNIIDNFISPIILVKYLKNFGGKITNVKIVKGDEILYNEKPNTAYDSTDNSECFKWEDESFKSLEPTEIKYDVFVSHTESESDHSIISVSKSSVTFNIYLPILYGTNNLECLDFCKTENTIDFKFNPSDYENPTNLIFIKIPNISTLKSVEYVQQRDTNAITLFEKSIDASNIKYEFRLGQKSKFLSPGEYIFKIVKSEQ